MTHTTPLNMPIITTIPRVFLLGGVELPDIPRLSPDQVKDFYAEAHPSLTNATISDPDYSDGKEAYTFSPKTGTKG